MSQYKRLKANDRGLTLEEIEKQNEEKEHKNE